MNTKEQRRDGIVPGLCSMCGKEPARKGLKTGLRCSEYMRALRRRADVQARAKEYRARPEVKAAAAAARRSPRYKAQRAVYYRSAAYRAANAARQTPERRAAQAAYSRRSDVKLRESLRRRERVFGVATDAFMQQATEGCAICGASELLCQDHDHTNNLIRGVVCRTHNRGGLGNFGDDVDAILAAVGYLAAPPATGLDLPAWRHGWRRRHPAAWEQLWLHQGRRCAITGVRSPGNRCGWALDHDHVTGQVRGIVTPQVNVALGHFRENVAHLRAAAAYLTFWRDVHARVRAAGLPRGKVARAAAVMEEYRRSVGTWRDLRAAAFTE